MKRSSISIYLSLLLMAYCFTAGASNGKDTIFTIDGKPLDMVFVKGGKFEMGSNEGKKDAKPAHQVELDDFYIGKFELTQEVWVAVMNSNPSEFKDCPRCPVNDMSWAQIQEFLQKLNKLTGKTFRLPTEAEWEFAAQGGAKSKGYTYSGSNKIEEVAWLKDNANGKLHEVGQLKPNELNLYDMNGNAWELCEDWYDPKYYERSPSKNPVNKEKSKYRVSRGASWMSPANYCERTARNDDHPHHRRGNGSFRVVMVK